MVLNIRIGVEGDRGDVVETLALHRLLVQGLDVAERVRKLEAGYADLVGGESVEHEGIVGVGTVRDADLARRGCGGGCRNATGCCGGVGTCSNYLCQWGACCFA